MTIAVDVDWFAGGGGGRSRGAPGGGRGGRGGMTGSDFLIICHYEFIVVSLAVCVGLENF